MHYPQCIVNVYIHETNGKGRKITSWWWLRWWSDWAKRCYPIRIMWILKEPTNDLSNMTQNRMIEWMVLFKVYPHLIFNFWKIMTESFSSISLSNNEVWFWKMIDLDSNRTGVKTDTDSGIWLRSSRDSKVSQNWCKNWVHAKDWCLHTFPITEMWS